MEPDPPEYEDVHPDLDALACIVRAIRLHPMWQQDLRKKVLTGFKDAREAVDYLNWKMSEKMERRIQREYEADPEAFKNQQLFVLTNWHEDTRDALARAVIYLETKDPKVLETPKLIKLVTK